MLALNDTWRMTARPEFVHIVFLEFMKVQVYP